MCRLNNHMTFWSDLSFKMIRAAHFDLLNALITYYFKKNEIEKLVHENKLTQLKLTNTHCTAWSLI